MRRQRGFTIVEAMLGMTIMVIVTLVVGGAFLIGYKAISVEAREIAADVAVSGATLSLTRDLQSATTPATGTVSAASTLTITYGSGGTVVTYSIDSRANLIRTVNGTPQVAARGLTSVTITAVGCYSTVTLQPSATGAAAQTLKVSNRVAGCV